MKCKLNLPLLFTAVISIAGCGGASFLPNSQTANIAAVSVTCSPSSIAIGGAAQCQAVVTGSGAYNSDVVWTADSGTISSSGLYTAPAANPASGNATVIVTATSKQDKSKSGQGVLKLSGTNNTTAASGITVTATPSSITMTQTATCSANINGNSSNSNAVVWTATGGTINQSGVFTPSGAGTGTCTATLVQDSTKSGTASIGISAAPIPGTGTATLSVNATTIAFGTLTLNTSATQSVTLTSTGTAAVTVSGASVTGTGFSISGATFPLTLNPNQTAQLFVVFDPTAAGSATGQLKITSNSSSGATTLVSLTGTGQSTSYQVNLSWNAPASSPDPVAGYSVFRAPTGTTAYQQLNTSAVTATNYVDGSVQNGTTYDYVVRSVDASGGLSVASNTFTAVIPQ